MFRHIAHYPDSRVFGHEALANMKFAETYIRRVGMGEQNELVGEDETPEVLRTLPLEGQTVCEITAEEGMLNVHGILSGGCCAHLVDVGTFSSLLMLSLATGNDATGVSAALNIIWHAPAPKGTQLRIVSTTLSLGGSVTAARCEVYNKITSRLLISAVHTINPFSKASSSKSKARYKL